MSLKLTSLDLKLRERIQRQMLRDDVNKQFSKGNKGFFLGEYAAYYCACCDGYKEHSTADCPNLKAADAKKNFADGRCNLTDALQAIPAISNPISKLIVLEIEPCPAPRMTRSDSWKGSPGCKIARRPSVQRYFDYRDAIRAAAGEIKEVPEGLDMLFRFTMPDSWSKKKKLAMDGKLHRQRPDIDNLVKACQDSLFDEDGAVAIVSAKKVWGRHPLVRIEFL